MVTGMHSCACGTTWGGHSACHCAGCHRTFTGESSFVRHRRDLQCIDPATARRKDGSLAFELNARGQWAVAMTDAQRASLSAMRSRQAQERGTAAPAAAARADGASPEGSGATAASNPGCAGAA